jgi:hypothetical protein
MLNNYTLLIRPTFPSEGRKRRSRVSTIPAKSIGSIRRGLEEIAISNVLNEMMELLNVETNESVGRTVL